MQATRSIRSIAIRGLIGSALIGAGLASLPAAADTVNWRQTSVAVSQGGGAFLRRGVAIFGNGDPAIMTVNIRMLSPPVEGRMPVSSQMEYVFGDGSALTLQMKSEARTGADGAPLRGEAQWTGEVVKGSGRYAGATGTFKLRVRTDIDGKIDGQLGDYFGAGEMTFELKR